MKTLVTITILLLQYGIAHADEGRESIPLFDITSTSFQKAVEYQANINSDCTFTKSNPVNAVWKDDSGQTEPLSFLENLVLGISVQTKQPQKIVGQVKTMKSHNQNWPLTIILGSEAGQNCQAQAKTRDDQIVKNINVLAFKDRAPTSIIVNGSTPVSF